MTGGLVSRETLRAQVLGTLHAMGAHDHWREGGIGGTCWRCSHDAEQRNKGIAALDRLLDALAEAERERDVQYDRANRAVRSSIANRDGRKAAEAVVERQREALAKAVRFLEGVAPPNDTTRNRISAALICLREAANGALL